MKLGKEKSPSFRSEIFKLWIFSLFLAVGLLGALIYWAFSAQIGGAVIASGRVTVESNVKTIQHSEGGYISEILVKDGDRVDANQVLIRLDQTDAVAELAVVIDQLNAAIAIEARLLSEADDFAHYEIANEDMLLVVPSDKFYRFEHVQKKLLETSKASFDGRSQQLTEQIHQTQEQALGLESQLQAIDMELALVSKDLERLQKLRDQGMVVEERLTTLRRSKVRLQGERGAVSSEVARSLLSISELRLQELQLQDDTRRNALSELETVRQEKLRLIQLKVKAENRLQRLDIRTPQAGIVHNMQISTLDGVVKSGEILMSLLPDQDTLVVEARLLPTDIDQVFVGQTATLMFTSFNMRTTPQLNGTVSRVSPDISLDDATGEAYYLVRLTIPLEELGRLRDQQIVPGMPVDAFILTGERTLINYIVQPIMDHLQRAMREA